MVKPAAATPDAPTLKVATINVLVRNTQFDHSAASALGFAFDLEHKGQALAWELLADLALEEAEVAVL